jgi:hypothetical protein
MDRIYTNMRHGDRRVHIEIGENEVADLLDDLLPLDHDAFAATHRFVAILEDANADFRKARLDEAFTAETDRT